MEVPTYVWISAIIIITISEFRKWIELIASYQTDDDESDQEPSKLPKELPKSIQHLYS